MSIQIRVPAMGESVTEATVSKWFKKQGDAVKRDEPLLELETDKVTVEVPAPADGSIESISVEEGATVQVGAVLGAIAEGAKGAASAAPSPAKPAAAKPAAPRPAARAEPPKPVSTPVMPSVRRIAEESGLDVARVAGTGRDGRVMKGDMLEALDGHRRGSFAARDPSPTGRDEEHPRANGKMGIRADCLPTHDGSGHGAAEAAAGLTSAPFPA